MRMLVMVNHGRGAPEELVVKLLVRKGSRKITEKLQTSDATRQWI